METTGVLPPAFTTSPFMSGSASWGSATPPPLGSLRLELLLLSPFRLKRRAFHYYNFCTRHLDKKCDIVTKVSDLDSLRIQ
jgi:hypothetical protein